ncbi:MAG TPA: hypothetical protein VIG97_03540 [Luteimonas sp.]
MAYTKREDVPARPGETVVELDTGELVAIGCTNTRTGSDLALHARGRVVDETGEPVADAAGRLIESAHPHTATSDALALHGVDALVRDCLMLVLGEETQVLAPSPAVRSAASIRAALEAVRNEGPVDAGAVL